MGFFGKKKDKEDVQQIKQVIKETKAPAPPQTVQPKLEPERKEERPTSAPLFVKIEKYGHILDSINYLRTTMATLENSFGVLNELEKLRDENIKILRNSLQNIEKKLEIIDSELLRPSGFHEEISNIEEVEGLSSTIEDLKLQIDQLKEDLQKVA